MQDDQRKHHPMATTQSKRRTACDSCANFASLRDEITDYIKRTDARLEDGSEEMNALAVEIRNLRHDTSETQRETSGLVREVLGSVNAINMRLASGQFLASAQRAGRDIENSTPGGKRPGIKIGPVDAHIPTWAVVLVLITSTLIVAVVGTAGYAAYRYVVTVAAK